MNRKSQENSETGRMGMLTRGSSRRAASLVTLWSLLLAPLALADRTPLKPGWNMFSAQQDSEVGQEVSKEAEKELRMLNDRRVDAYLSDLGRRLADRAPGEKYPYRFKVVDDRAINAFALPGGPVYINRGVIEAADNEAQLAGVIAHEISHVALRHGTNQASKASAAQMPLAILGGLLGSDSIVSTLAQLGASFTVNSILLKYSRTAETQADTLGTQILYDAGYDARAMARFFEKLQEQDQGGQPIEFFSNHPNPGNRIQNVGQEIDNLGGDRRGYNNDSREFDQITRYIKSLPAPPSSKGQQILSDDGSRDERGRQGSGPDWPSDRYVRVENALVLINHPDNWQAYGQGDAMTITPRGGMVEDGNGRQALAYGVIVNIFEPRGRRYGQQLQGPGYGQGRGQDSLAVLERATEELVQELRLSNRNMRVVRSGEPLRVNGSDGLSTYLSNDSPIGGRETNWLVTVNRPDGLLFLVFTAPDRDFQGYENDAFRRMMYSVQINR